MVDAEGKSSMGGVPYRMHENELHDLSREATNERRKRIERLDDPQDVFLLFLEPGDSGFSFV
jgi:hypothetical protein